MAHDALEMVEYTDNPPIIVFGDTDAALARGCRTAENAGLRVVSAGLVEAAIERLDFAAPASIFVDLDNNAPDKRLPALFDRMQAEADAGWSGIVAAPRTLIDLVAAHLLHADIAHLCEATEWERAAAVRLAVLPGPARLHDVSRDGEALMQQALLHQLSEEVGRIADILATLSDEEEGAAIRARALAGEAEDEAGIDAGQIRGIIRARRLRDQYFRSELFADPAWDMLLDLMAARIEKNRVAVSSLCIAAAVPATTALRWIKALTDRGLFVRSADPRDGRRVYIELSDDAARSVAAYLRAAQRIAPSVI